MQVENRQLNPEVIKSAYSKPVREAAVWYSISTTMSNRNSINFLEEARQYTNVCFNNFAIACGLDPVIHQREIINSFINRRKTDLTKPVSMATIGVEKHNSGVSLSYPHSLTGLNEISEEKRRQELQTDPSLAETDYLLTQSFITGVKDLTNLLVSFSIKNSKKGGNDLFHALSKIVPKILEPIDKKKYQKKIDKKELADLKRTFSKEEIITALIYQAAMVKGRIPETSLLSESYVPLNEVLFRLGEILGSQEEAQALFVLIRKTKYSSLFKLENNEQGEPQLFLLPISLSEITGSSDELKRIAILSNRLRQHSFHDLQKNNAKKEIENLRKPAIELLK